MYDRMMSEKLDGFDMQYFQKHWLQEAAEIVRSDVRKDFAHFVPPVEKHIVEVSRYNSVPECWWCLVLLCCRNLNSLFNQYVLRRFDPDPKSGYWSGKRCTIGTETTPSSWFGLVYVRGEEAFHATVGSSEHLQVGELHDAPNKSHTNDYQIMLEKIFLEMYCNCKNNRGMTPLHVASYENLTCSHEDVIRCLLDEYGADVKTVDSLEKSAYDYLVEPRSRFKIVFSLLVR